MGDGITTYWCVLRRVAGWVAGGRWDDEITNVMIAGSFPHFFPAFSNAPVRQALVIQPLICGLLWSMASIWRFLEMDLQFSSIYRWSFHEINHPASLGIPHKLETPSTKSSNLAKSFINYPPVNIYIAMERSTMFIII